MAGFNPPEVAELHQITKNLLEIWMRLKLAFQKAFGKGEISKEQEAAFLQLKSDLARHYRSLSDRLPKDLQFEGELMMDMLKNAISMERLQNLPTTDKRNIFGQWHKIYVKISRSFGALEVIHEGYYPALHRDLLKDPGKKKLQRSGSGKAPPGKTGSKPTL